MRELINNTIDADWEPMQPSQTGQPPNSGSGGFAKFKKGFKIFLTIFKVWFWVFTTIAFMLFICEESTQLLGFSRFGYKTIGTAEAYKEWIKACERDKPIVDKMEDVAAFTFFVNPISSKVFLKYFQQENEKLRREMWIANKLLAKEKGKEAAKLARDTAGVVLASSFTQVAQAAQTEVVLTMRSVYSTRTGSTYHKATCYHLYKDSKQKLGIRQHTPLTAQQSGLKPCSRCKPGRA